MNRVKLFHYQDTEGNHVKLWYESFEDAITQDDGEVVVTDYGVLKIFENGMKYAEIHSGEPFSESWAYTLQESIQQCVEDRVPARELEFTVDRLLDSWLTLEEMGNDLVH